MAINQARAVEVKGRRYSLMSLKLLRDDLAAIRKNIKEVTQQAPVFFKNTPVIVDFSLLEINVEFDFNTLFKIIRKEQLLPVAVCGIPPGLREKMQSVGVPIVEPSISNTERLQAMPMQGTDSDAEKKTVSQLSRTVVVELPDGASESFFSEYGDLIIIGDTGANSELIAAGNIHVYGALRGRVLAGIQGDIEARIFCHSLCADHVSIAGVGLSLKGVSSVALSSPLQVSLKDYKLVAVPLG